MPTQDCPLSGKSRIRWDGYKWGEGGRRRNFASPGPSLSGSQVFHTSNNQHQRKADVNRRRDPQKRAPQACRGIARKYRVNEVAGFQLPTDKGNKSHAYHEAEDGYRPVAHTTLAATKCGTTNPCLLGECSDQGAWMRKK